MDIIDSKLIEFLFVKNLKKNAFPGAWSSIIKITIAVTMY